VKDCIHMFELMSLKIIHSNSFQKLKAILVLHKCMRRQKDLKKSRHCSGGRIFGSKALQGKRCYGKHRTAVVLTDNTIFSVFMAMYK
jgi:hypothetical protein